MKQLKLYSLMAAIILIGITTSCTSSSTKTEDNQQVSKMDSVSQELDKTNKELAEEAKKVEASLDKVDKEFNAAK